MNISYRKHLTLIVLNQFAMVYSCKNVLQRAGIVLFLFKHFCVAILDFQKTKQKFRRCKLPLFRARVLQKVVNMYIWREWKKFAPISYLSPFLASLLFSAVGHIKVYCFSSARLRQRALLYLHFSVRPFQTWPQTSISLLT